MLRAIGGAATVGGAAASYVAVDTFGYDNLKRSMSYNQVAIPGFVAYKYTDWKTKPERGVSPEERNAAFAKLDEEWAGKALEKIYELRGFYVKNGQMIAGNVGDAAPPIWQDTMKPLLDDCPNIPFEVVKGVVEKDLGGDIDDFFDDFETKPLAAASIGQVHRARVKGTGERVVVKVQYPGVEGVFRGDVRTIKTFCQLAMPEHVPVFDEIEKQFMTEFDYVKEAENLSMISANIAKEPKFLGKGAHEIGIVVPKPITKLCTKNVLTMEELHPAQKLADGLKEDLGTFAKLRGMTPEALTEEERKLDEQAWAEGREREGPGAAEMDKVIGFVDQSNSARQWLGRFGLGWAYPALARTMGAPVLEKARAPMNHARMVDRLLEVHGHEIFVDGAFNGDPHPGNFLLVQPGNMIGLIDYGQVKVMTLEQRLVLARLIKALCDGDDEKIAASMYEAGFRTKHQKQDVICKMARLYYDRNNKASTEGLHVQLYLEKLQAEDPIVSQADDYLMCGRVAVMLRGFGDALHQPRSTAQAWLPFAEALLREAGELPPAAPAEVQRRAKLARRNSRLHK
mmetsp:Transcript_61199/g.167794  ORF Transcript_61199/g.167794 Transcript_61199/m.167794 type:complete len:569 (+) Transcript_61199:296-2002(+)